jgi:hypothetical protein
MLEPCNVRIKQEGAGRVTDLEGGNRGCYITNYGIVTSVIDCTHWLIKQFYLQELMLLTISVREFHRVLMDIFSVYPILLRELQSTMNLGLFYDCSPLVRFCDFHLQLDVSVGLQSLKASE